MKSSLVFGRIEFLMLVALSILWGGSFFFAKVALTDFAPLTLVFMRVSLATIALGIFLALTHQSFRPTRGLVLAFAGMGIVNNLIPFSLLFFGQTHIGAGLASIFNALVPVFTVLVAHQFTDDEKLNPTKIAGVAFGVLGIVVLIGLDMNIGTSGWTLVAMFACLAAALSYGFASVYGRRFHAMGVTPVQVAFGQVAATSVMILPIALMVDGPISLSAPALSSWIAVLSLALFSTALAYVLFFKILARSGATAISLVTFLIPISAITLGCLFLEEQLAWNQVLGMALVFTGLMILNDSIKDRITTFLKSLRPRPAPLSSAMVNCDQPCSDRRITCPNSN